VEHAPPDEKHYGNSLLAFIAAAAQRWKVGPASATAWEDSTPDTFWSGGRGRREQLSHEAVPRGWEQARSLPAITDRYTVERRANSDQSASLARRTKVPAC